MKIEAGVNPHAKFGGFSDQELRIIEIFAARDWYITRADKITLANSTYRIILAKPLEYVTEAFNIHREVVVAFSSYSNFEPRCVDAIEYLDVQELRLEEICSIMISNDPSIDSKVKSLLNNNNESRVIIPFTYEELLSEKANPDKIINRIRDRFYSRDLFGLHTPLTKDLYFFGRKDIIHDLLNRHKCGENSGIFGLRKTGKTSILYGVERALNRKESTSVLFDCQTLHLKSWMEVIQYIVKELAQKTSYDRSKIRSVKPDITAGSISEAFVEDIVSIFKHNNRKGILIIFDEIEHLTFDTSISKSWKSGEDFIKFWQVIRSAFQATSSIGAFTFLVTGTNPRCIEVPSIEKVDNPIFNQFSPQYIPAFTFDQTKEMVQKLGGHMGIIVESTVCAQLVTDFGGHPLLMRQMCSYIHSRYKQERPVRIGKALYESYRIGFLSDADGFARYAQMIIEVLENWYPDEIDMLIWLAIGDLDTFKEYASNFPELISHLLRYNIIEEQNGEYGFKMDALKMYLAAKNQYRKQNLSNEERQAEISKRRNAIEMKLRKIVRNQLRATFGEADAIDKVRRSLKIPSGARATPFRGAYSDLFDPSKNEIYFSILSDLIGKYYEECFRNIFDVTKDEFSARTTLINKFRRFDAHAGQVSDSDFQSFRGIMDWLEEKVRDF